MTRTRLILLAALSLLLFSVPGVAAQDTDDVDVRYHERGLLVVQQTGTECESTGVIHDLQWPHSHDVVNATYWITMKIQVVLMSGINPRELIVEAVVSDTTGPLNLFVDAQFRKSSGADSSNDMAVVSSRPSTLTDTDLPLGPLYVEVTQIIALGGDPIIWCNVDLTLHSLESIPMTMEISTALDQWIPFIFWGILAILMFARVAFAPALVASIMFANNVLEEPVLSMQFGLLLFVITLILHVVAVNGFFPGLGKGRDPA